jgi:hypothetical protein
MIALGDITEVVVAGFVLTILCIVAAIFAGILEKRSYHRRYLKWLKEAEDDSL